jgi:hypothetical protein
VPRALIDRPDGFGVPLAGWFRGELRERMESYCAGFADVGSIQVRSGTCGRISRPAGPTGPTCCGRCSSSPGRGMRHRRELIRSRFRSSPRGGVEERRRPVSTGVVDSFGVLELIAFLEDAFRSRSTRAGTSSANSKVDKIVALVRGAQQGTYGVSLRFDVGHRN